MGKKTLKRCMQEGYENAVECKNEEMIIAYIKAGVEIIPNAHKVFDLAIEKRDTNLLQVLIDHVSDIKHVGHDALLYSITRRKIEHLIMLINAGVMLTSEDIEVMIDFDCYQYITVISHLIEDKVDDTLKNFSNVLLAYRLNNLEPIHHLFEITKDKEFCELILEWAARKGHIDIIDCLQLYKGNFKEIGDRAFISACENNNLKVAKKLIEYEVDFEKLKTQALKIAIEFSSFKIVRYLIQEEVDVTEFKNELLNKVIERCDIQMLKFLVEKNLISNVRISNPACCSSLEMLKMLSSANVDFVKLKKMSIKKIMWHVEAANVVSFLVNEKIISLTNLLEYYVNSFGNTFELLSEFIMHSEEITIDDEFFIKAIIAENVSALKVFIKKDVDITTHNNFSLEYAKASLNSELKKLMIEAFDKLNKTKE